MVFVCPNEECGRKFDEEGPMIEHVRRRHPECMDKLENVLSKTIMFADRKKEEEIAKLPRLKMRPSQSKDKPKDTLPTVLTKKLHTPATILSNTRMEVRAMEASENAGLPKLTKLEPQRLGSRGSLKEENASMQLNATSQLTTPKNDFRRTVLRRKSSKDTLERLGSDDKKEQQDRLGTAATANDFSSMKPPQWKEQSESGASTRLEITGRKPLLRSPQLMAEKPIIRISKSKEKPRMQLASSTSTAGFSYKRPLSKSKQSSIKDSVVEKAEKVLTKEQLDKPESLFDPSILEQSSTVIIKSKMKAFSPPFTCIEYLSLNGCGLTAVSLEGLELLKEFSATHNSLRSMQFVMYSGNENLTTVHLDSNHIEQLALPRNLEVLTLAFNQIGNFEQLGTELGRNSSISELDLSFNPIKKLYNYKYELLLRGKSLKKLDGLKITKHDIDLALEYKAITCREKPQDSAQKGTARYYDRFQRRIKEDYSYAIAEKLTEEQYQKLKRELDDYLRRTDELQANMDVIQTENGLLEEELALIRVEQSDNANVFAECATLQAQVETLEMLNMLQFADEQELMQLIQAAEAKL